MSVHSVELDLKANAATVQQDFVLRDHFDELFTTLGSSVDQKAQQTDVEVINSNVQDVIGQSNEISKQLAIALRFIEWFTSRGVNYEYNIGIIDKHLGGLADIGQKRKPFSNGIRYTAAVDSSDIDMSPITYPVAVEPTDTDTTTAAAAAATATSTTGGISAGTVDISTAESANTTLNNSIESVFNSSDYENIQEDEINEAENYQDIATSAGTGIGTVTGVGVGVGVFGDDVEDFAGTPAGHTGTLSVGDVSQLNDSFFSKE